MKIWQITDTHFGKGAIQTEKWLNMMSSYFYDFLIPILKKHVKPGDVLLHLGDVYDNRTSINVKVLNKVINIFEDLSKILPVHILIGNHDNFNLSDNDINSVASIRNINNIYTYSEPTLKTFGNTKCLLLPWVYGKNNEKEVLAAYNDKAKILFCHSDLNGARTQVNPTRPISKTICELDDFSGYTKVYSGHIHIRQTISNFSFIGAPYHMDRNDIGNEKGITVVDPDTLQEKFIPNTFSPKFNKIYIDTIEDLDTIDKNYVNNNYVDLIIKNSLIIKDNKARLKIDDILSKSNFETVDYIDDVINETNDEANDNIISDNDNTNDIVKDIKQITIDWVETKKIYENKEANELIISSIKDIINSAFDIRERDIKLSKNLK